MIAFVFNSQFVILCSVIVIIVVLLISIIVRKHLKKDINIKNDIKKSFFVFYLVIIFCFTLLPIVVPPLESENIIWNFNVLELFKAFSDRSSFINVAGNVMLFIPIPILGYMSNISAFSSLLKTTIITFGMSLAIELMQVMENIAGIVDPSNIVVVDINDIITNTCGGIIGALVVKFYKKQK